MPIDCEEYLGTAEVYSYLADKHAGPVVSKAHIYFANYILDVCFMCENACENASKQKFFKVQSSHKQLEIILKGIYCVK